MKLLMEAKDIKPSDFVKYHPKKEESKIEKSKAVTKTTNKKDDLCGDLWDDRDYDYWMRMYDYY